MQRDHPSLQPRLRPTCWSGGSRQHPVHQPGFLEHSSLPSMQRGGSSGRLGARVVCEPAAGLGGKGSWANAIGYLEGPWLCQAGHGARAQEHGPWASA